MNHNKYVYFETFGWVTGTWKGIWLIKSLCHFFPKVLFLNRWMKETKIELADPSSSGKPPLRRR